MSEPRKASGYLLVETLVALAIIGFALVSSVAVLTRGAEIDRLAAAAALRTELAAAAMERMLAEPFQTMASVTEPIAPKDVGGQRGWLIHITVREDEDLPLKRVIVTVEGGGRRTTLTTLVAPWSTP